MLTTRYCQFICWIAVPSKDRPGKTDKFPASPYTGQVCNAHDRQQWVSLATAQAAVAAGMGHGVAFVFAETDPYFFLDIDDCLTADGWSPLAVQLCQQFAGCFIEVSQSGKGLHIFGTRADSGDHGCKNSLQGLELYTKARFAALTFHGATGSVDHRISLEPLLALPGWSSTVSGELDADWSDRPVPEWSGPVDDLELISRMMQSKPSAGSIMGNRATIQDLWLGNVEALSRCYPDPRGFDHSSADAALCSHLAFWTGKDCERIDRLFRMSALMRDKWDRSAGQGKTYGQLTILKCISATTNVLGKRESAAVPAESDSETDMDGLRSGVQYMTTPSQIDYFKGCVYIRDLHRILIPDGGLLKSEQFNATYGGWVFALDAAGEKTSRKAFEVFTENAGYSFPKVHEACFRPELPPAAVVEEEGRTMVNVYTPITTACTPGDPSPFINHVHKLIPDPQDRAILLAYMAALVQYPGVKFQWSPLVQGVQGNGKTLLITALTHAVGSRYTHLPNPEDISNKFNAWLLGKLFIGIEEIYVADRRELINVLKPMITNRRVDIQGKGADQKTGDNRANFMITTNHKDAMLITEEDRRYAIFFSAQQHKEDLLRDGMGGSYFPDLYRWADNGGYAIINHYLRRYTIPDALNPATTCHRAPATSSTLEAIKSSLGSIEQEVLEAIEEGRSGFAGGWISSLAFDRLLDDRKLSSRLPRARRKDLLQSLGYVWHPGLPNGRCNNPIVDVGGITGKPVLYIKRGHYQSSLTLAKDIVGAYRDAQSGSTQAAIIMLDRSVS